VNIQWTIAEISETVEQSQRSVKRWNNRKRKNDRFSTTESTTTGRFIWQPNTQPNNCREIIEALCEKHLWFNLIGRDLLESPNCFFADNPLVLILFIKSAVLSDPCLCRECTSKKQM
jgi:hypothetical protein